jgi:hypothetical protein
MAADETICKEVLRVVQPAAVEAAMTFQLVYGESPYE